MLNNLEKLKIDILGASHASRITLIVDGLPKGKKIDLEIDGKQHEYEGIS